MCINPLVVLLYYMPLIICIITTIVCIFLSIAWLCEKVFKYVKKTYEKGSTIQSMIAFESQNNKKTFSENTTSSPDDSQSENQNNRNYNNQYI